MNCSLTGASPAGTYAHSADRDWENDEVRKETFWKKALFSAKKKTDDTSCRSCKGTMKPTNGQLTPPGCEDIASQLATGQTGRQFKVVLGGGDQHFRQNGKFSTIKIVDCLMQEAS